jgi:hypothetical protein
MYIEKINLELTSLKANVNELNKLKANINLSKDDKNQIIRT